jgi:hypothetical protein
MEEIRKFFRMKQLAADGPELVGKREFAIDRLTSSLGRNPGGSRALQESESDGKNSAMVSIWAPAFTSE